MADQRTAFRTCPLCEATCGLELTVNGGVSRVRGDKEDVFSHGFLCPKGVSLKELHEDPDRLRTPMRRRDDGTFEPIGWDDAFALIDERLGAVIAAGGRDAVAVYLGNPSAHGLSSLIYGRVLLKALGTKNIFSASTVDQYPKQLASALMFGGGLTVGIPDLDRTQYLLCLGANPLASNGSLMTAPDARGRLQGIQARGGKLVVIDPRRSRTAQVADEHFFIRPGSDALLLAAIAHTLFAEGLVDLGTAAEHVAGVDEVHAAVEPFSADAVAPATGIAADDIRRIARELAAAESAAVYGRIGTTTQSFGTVASWLVDVVNALTGNLDRPGGVMFTRAAAGASNTKGEPGRGRGTRFGRWQSRVRGMDEVFGELPVACLAEEIETSGDGQVRALLTIAGNPLASTPNSGRLTKAVESLDFMVSLDIYVNETTRHADVILPALSHLEHSQYDLIFNQFAVRNVAKWSPPVFDPPEGALDEWQTLLRLAGIAGGAGPDADVAAMDDMLATDVARRESSDPHSPLAGREPADILAAAAPWRGPERVLDIMLRGGPYALTMDDLVAAPHGIDLGPLQPRLPEVLRTESGKVELAPERILADVPRLEAALATAAEGLVLIGRRDLRSNNSWMHNLPLLVRGPVRCTAWLHPDDAARLGLADGALARVSSRAGSIELPVEITEDVMAGVVSIPHGWGHDQPGMEMGVAREHAGVNSNVLTDEHDLEPITGTAVLNGIPIVVEPVEATTAAAGAGAASPA
ncbi:MAG: molybdopterin oxidoreductase [Solirubrobacteraceae bacterium]|nr:molybdopterin oxidoreductase [Solirubrobacteraceae bacterium]